MAGCARHFGDWNSRLMHASFEVRNRLWSQCKSAQHGKTYTHVGTTTHLHRHGATQHRPPLLWLQPSTKERKGTRPFIRLCRKGPPVSTLAHGLTVMRQGAERVGLKGLQLGALGRSIFVFLRPKRSGRCIGKRPRSDSRQKPLLAPGP